MKTLSRRTAAAAILAMVLGLSATAGTGIAAADTSPLQPTVQGCSLQGGCPADASSVSPAESAALNWARSQLGIDEYEGWCLQFVYDAYMNGAGVDIGVADSAVDYWNARPDMQHAGDTNPPAGALVFWGATDANPYGHVGIAEGGDTVISSEERTTYTIHEFSIADRNSDGYPYLGWILPA